MVKRWKSLIDHICDIHEDCYHSELSDRSVKYLAPGNYTYVMHAILYLVIIWIGSKAYEKLSDVVLSK